MRPIRHKRDPAAVAAPIAAWPLREEGAFRAAGCGAGGSGVGESVAHAEDCGD